MKSENIYFIPLKCSFFQCRALIFYPWIALARIDAMVLCIVVLYVGITDVYINPTDIARVNRFVDHMKNSFPKHDKRHSKKRGFPMSIPSLGVVFWGRELFISI